MLHIPIFINKYNHTMKQYIFVFCVILLLLVNNSALSNKNFQIEFKALDNFCSGITFFDRCNDEDSCFNLICALKKMPNSKYIIMMPYKCDDYIFDKNITLKKFNATIFNLFKSECNIVSPLFPCYDLNSCCNIAGAISYNNPPDTSAAIQLNNC